MTQRLWDLTEELVCDDEAKAIFSSLREDLGECLCCKVLELIDIEEKWNSSIFVCSSSSHGCLIYLGHEHSTQESHDLFLESSFWELDEEDFAIVHDFPEIELVLCRYEDILHHIDREELSDLVENRHDCLIVELLRPTCEFIGPEVSHDIISYMFDHHIAEILVRERSDHIEYSRIRYIEKCQEEHPENVLELRIPICPEEFFEYIDKSFCKDLLRFSRFYSEWIEAKRELFIRWVEYDDVIFSIFWYMHHDLFNEIPMRIYDRESLTIIDIIDHL